MPQSNRYPSTTETGEQVPARPHDSGSAANETVDGLDAKTEALRHAAEDTPSGTGHGDIEKTPSSLTGLARPKNLAAGGRPTPHGTSSPRRD